MTRPDAVRTFHIVSINERTGSKAYCTRAPLTHGEACAMLKTFTEYTWRRLQLEDAAPTARLK